MGFMFPLALLAAFATEEESMISVGEHVEIHSEILGEDRKLAIGLPYGYETSEAEYPVLVVLNCGSPTALAHAVSTMEILDGKSQAPQMIVVGIDDGNGVRDYFPQPLEGRPGSGHAEAFLQFILMEVIPFVEQEYRASSCRVLYGASNAGMFTVYAMLTETGSFSGYIAASPSLAWFSDYFNQAVSCFDPDDGTRFYMNWGSDDIQSIVLNATPELSLLFSGVFAERGSYSFEKIESGGHVPYLSLHNGLRFVFQSFALDDSLLFAGGLDGLVQHYGNLSVEFGYAVNVPSGKFMSLGQKYLREGSSSLALEVFLAYRESYPRSSMAWFLTGETYRTLADTASAAECYRYALDLNPGLAIAGERLQALSEGGV